MATAKAQERTDSLPQRTARGDLGKAIWLDCDPGHDDAIAMLMACFAPSTMTSESNAPNAFDLLGVSVVAGNAPATATFANAARLLTLFDAPLPQSPSAMDSQAVHLFNGSEVPLLKEPRSDPAIHGADGLGGVTGLPNLDDERVLRRAWASYKDQPEHHKSSVDNATPSLPPPGPGALLLHWQALLEHRINAGMPKMTMIATGPLTNVALLVRAFPRLVELGVSEIVIMGGAPPGTRGNRGPLAEFNILVDPEAASIVFDFNVPIVMAGLNVTHQAIFSPRHQARLLQKEHTNETPPTPFRRTLASIMTFFAETYKSEFGFLDGPPIHDVLAVAYALDETLFYGRDEKGRRTVRPPRRNVQVETNAGSLALGATVFDEYAKGVDRPDPQWWGRGGNNVLVLEDLDVDRMWDLFFACVERAEAHKAKLAQNEEDGGSAVDTK